ncbi:E3 ubiquitin-protein ligase rad18 [Scheffersomyces spartinae]|uniref:RING-type E3 ubiquitin transferase n=1 Tax=Scheffersomyces spartinae TaxID=45513 RepID=A0A9P8AJD8_9ASCO|nr:E3 ubiquitin-protein ligase rad18 [Scheffersomyces spartinae]KAG7194670.1 E3 ubiquitin-protein ligase rad18 [Scheffersomyces spartinae]
MEQKRPASSSPSEIVEVLLSDESANSTNTNNTVPVKRHKREPESESGSMVSPSPSSDNMAECPICGEIMPADIIERKHLDDCLKGKKTKPSKSTKRTKNNSSTQGNILSFFTANNERKKRQIIHKRDHEHYYFHEASTHGDLEHKKLPKLDFSSLSTSKLKEKLSALEIPTSGTRQQLELRYNHYYVLYNSNLDCNHPLVEKVLRLKLSQWESSHLAFTPTTTRHYNSSKLITDKDFLPTLWVASHRDEFLELTRAAKATLKANMKKSKSKSQTKSNTTPESSEPPNEDQLNCDQSLLFSVPGL